jgi:hypothetical protein
MYGHTCETNFEWAWCPRAAQTRAADLRITLGGLGRFTGYPRHDYVAFAQRAAPGPSESPIVRIERGRDGHFRVTYQDGAEFAIDPTASEIFGVARGDLTPEDLLTYVQGPVLGFVLRLRGVLCLHGSAAVAANGAFAVVGPAGMGKSTNAAMLARLGLEVLTDDVLALADGGASYHVQPGLPRVLLWPESVAALFGDRDALPRIVSTWDKRYLDLAGPGYRFAQKPARLRAIYVLGERLPAGATPEITDLDGAAALVHLLANTYANDLLDGKMRALELGALGRLVGQTPVRLLRAPDERSALPRIGRTLVDDFSVRS